MTIARNPKTKDAQAARFIRKDAGKRNLVTVGVLFDEDMLARIDAVARSMGLKRSPFIVNAVAEKLLKLEHAQ